MDSPFFCTMAVGTTTIQAEPDLEKEPVVRDLNFPYLIPADIATNSSLFETKSTATLLTVKRCHNCQGPHPVQDRLEQKIHLLERIKKKSI